MWEVGTVLAARCQHEGEPDQCLPYSRVVVSFSIVTSSDDYLYEIHTRSLSEERTGENGDVKKVLVLFSTFTTWITGVGRSAGAADGETESRAERETRGVELSSRIRWVPIQPSSIGTVTQLRCHENDETASVRRCEL